MRMCCIADVLPYIRMYRGAALAEAFIGVPYTPYWGVADRQAKGRSDFDSVADLDYNRLGG